MTMADDYAKYWDRTYSDGYGVEIYWSSQSDAEEHLPTPVSGRSSGSLCISANSAFKWLSKEQTWEEM